MIQVTMKNRPASGKRMRHTVLMPFASFEVSREEDGLVRVSLRERDKDIRLLMPLVETRALAGELLRCAGWPESERDDGPEQDGGQLCEIQEALARIEHRLDLVALPDDAYVVGESQ